MRSISVFHNHALIARIFQDAQPADYEIFSGLIPGGETMRRVTTLDHAFELRSVDMQFRVRVAVTANHQEAGDPHIYPYIIHIKNLMLEETSGVANTPDGLSKPIELKHGASGYLWIEPGDATAQRTGAQHTFELRTRNHELMLTITLGDTYTDEL